MNEKPVLVLGPTFGIFRTVCEVVDVPEDPESKIFRFKEGCKWGNTWDKDKGPLKVRHLAIYSSWPVDDAKTPLEEPGECLGDYRVTRALDAPQGYVAAYEGTTRPAVPVVVPEVDPDAERCEDAITAALATTPEIPIRELKRKTHADRYCAGLWDATLNALTARGVLRTEERRGLVDKPRLWVVAVTNTGTAVSPTFDSANGAAQVSDSARDK